MDTNHNEEPLCCENYGIIDCATAFQAPVVSKLIHFSYWVVNTADIILREILEIIRIFQICFAREALFLSFSDQLELLYSVIFFGHFLFRTCQVLLCLRFRGTRDSCGLCVIQFHPAPYTKKVSYPRLIPQYNIYCQTFAGHSHPHGSWNATNSGKPTIVVCKSWILISYVSLPFFIHVVFMFQVSIFCIIERSTALLWIHYKIILFRATFVLR